MFVAAPFTARARCRLKVPVEDHETTYGASDGPGRPRLRGSPAERRSNVIALVVSLRDDVPVTMRFAVSVVTAERTHDHDVLLLTPRKGSWRCGSRSNP